MHDCVCIHINNTNKYKIIKLSYQIHNSAYVNEMKITTPE